ncbi:MAG: glycosyltransferase [Acidimicrobiales bacterium]
MHGVLVTYRRPEALARILDVLTRQSTTLDSLVVVDNAPSPATAAVVGSSTAAAQVDYLASAENLGPAGGIAAGMRHALSSARDDDWIAVFDDDDPPTHDQVLEQLLRRANTSGGPLGALGGIGARGARLDRRRGRLHPVTAEPSGVAPADYLKSGWFPLYRVEAVRRVGVFASELFFAFDDLEYGLRLRAAGYTVLVTDAAGARGDPPTVRPRAQLGPVDWRRYYSLRNLVHILGRHGHRTAAARVALVVGVGKPLSNVFITPGLAWRHLVVNLRAVHDGWRHRLGRTIEPDARPRPEKTAPRQP